MELNIEEIAKNCAKGNFEDFGKLYDAYNNKIYRFVYFRTHHKETAEDITAVVFTKVLEKFNTFDSSKASFSTWIYQIARNTIVDFYRTKKETNNIEDAWDIASNSNIERDTDTLAALEKVKAYLNTLPASQRDIVIMRVWDGLTHKEIAGVLGISEANSKMTFSRVLAKLNQEVAVALMLLLLLKPTI